MQKNDIDDGICRKGLCKSYYKCTSELKRKKNHLEKEKWKLRLPNGTSTIKKQIH